MADNQNLLAAVVLSLMILLGFHYFYEKPRLEEARAAAIRQQTVQKATTPVEEVASAAQPRSAIIATGFASNERVKIATPRLTGSLNLRGGRIDDLILSRYRTAPDPNSSPVTLLTPAASLSPDAPYYAEFGYLADSGVAVPGSDTLWQASAAELAPGSPLVLTWENGAGLRFERTITVDEDYMFTFADRVTNQGSAAVTLYPYGRIARQDEPHTDSMGILHEGLIGVFDGQLAEHKYTDLRDAEAKLEHTGVGGWLGITDKYWLVSLVPDSKAAITANFTHVPAKENQRERFQADFRGNGIALAPGTSVEQAARLFAGAKEVKLLDRYEKTLGITSFDLAVDFGWFYFLTKPFFYALDWLAHMFAFTGFGFGCAILIFTVVLKGIFYPLQQKSYIAMNRMKLLQPKVNDLRDKYKEDKMRMNQEMMELYRREKVNPMSGCMPILLQIPVFFALYKVLYVTIEMRHAPFPGWINDLAAPDPLNVFTLFGLVPWNPPSLLILGIWPILMGITMWLQQKMSPAPTDATQQNIFRWLPLVFTFLLAGLPVGLVIYWTWSNMLGIAQQWALMRHMKANPVALKAN